MRYLNKIPRAIARYAPAVLVAAYALSALAQIPLPSGSTQVVPVSAASPPASVDFTSLAIALSGAALSILGAVATAIVNKYVKDAAARAMIDDAISHSIGTLQQVAQGSAKALDPHLEVPPRFAAYAPAVQYAVDHAGDSLARLGITHEMVAERIEAKLGLANVAHNLAVTGNPTPAVALPLSAVPVA